ncbi:alanine racemase [Paraglaciecola sp. L3A3]|uniref:alanine racemase n=1 Tax=Paraglaciecola sp. L3A3 TaxID=2686358 RepID=UPI00131C369D|nr:alanine racemase [Paraglaciecola sp. L3A3]
MSRPTKIIIDLAAIRANCQLAQSLAPHSKTLAVVKADAYGHGAGQVAQAIEPLVDMLTVTCLEEALDLRQAGISKPVLLLEGFFTVDEVDLALANDCELVLHTQRQVIEILSMTFSQPIRVWLKVDTGMHRLGISAEFAHSVYSMLNDSPNISQIILMSHFSCADELKNGFTRLQYQSFTECLELIEYHAGVNKNCIVTSFANSAAICGWPDYHLDWIRPGLMLYGISPFDTPHTQGDKLLPAMTFSSEVIAVRHIEAGDSVGYGNTWTASKPSVIATVAVGYGDGYPRNIKSGAPIIVNGQRATLVGRVSMDLICVDVTGISDVAIGADVELWGKNLSVNEVAKWADTIGYELVTRMPSRVKPSYINE